MLINVTKKSGESLLFDPEKLKSSLERSGAGTDDIRYIVSEVEKELYDGITTRKIYRKAYTLLKKVSSGAAGRYRLKEAIMELGPTGFPFEKFVGELFRYQGYKVNTGKIIQGRCVSHEVDVVAEKEDEVLMMECKFHALPGRKSDVKVSLYIHSRFEDIRAKRKENPVYKENCSFHGGLVTNTRFTGDAIDYGSCAGLKMISWDFPGSGSLKNRIDISGLFPITCLFSLRKIEKKQLIERGVVMCKELCEDPAHIKRLEVSHTRYKRILQEVTSICNSKIHN